MSDEISKVAAYDPANPYPVLNPNAAPFVIDSLTQVAVVPSYESMLLGAPADEVEGGDSSMSRKQKAALAVLAATGGIKPTEPSKADKDTAKEEAAEQAFLNKQAELPPPKPKEPRKKGFFNY